MTNEGSNMKPEKMTDEELQIVEATTRRASERGWTGDSMRKMLSHIAALTAELDEERTEAEAQAAMVDAWSDALGLEKTDGYDKAEAIREERDALRERVRAVEARERAIDVERDAAARRMEIAESRLASIRRRAGDRKATHAVGFAAFDRRGAHVAEVVDAVARYIVGEDAPGDHGSCTGCRAVSALTDAPPVFTLEEVEGVMGDVVDPDDVKNAQIIAAVVRRLTSLRRTP